MAKAKTVDDPATTSPSLEDLQCWKHFRDPKRRTWVGFFIDTATALAWVKSRPDADAYTVNNVPPPTSNRFRTADVETNVVATQPKPSQYGPGRVARDAAAAQMRELQAQERNSKEMRRLKNAAAKRLAKHKADEARDLEKGDE